MNVTKQTFVSLIALTGALAVSGVAAATETSNAAGTVISFTPSNPTHITQHQMDNAKSKMPMLTDRSQIPGYSDGAFDSMAYGTGGHPFTTKRVALQNGGKGLPTSMKPYRRTGKLYMDFGGSIFVCSASVIDKGILVTAAHCVHNFGMEGAGWADSIRFEPARHGASVTFGSWDAFTWTIPTVYYNGTDVCLPTAPGVVCENDIAVVAMDTGPAPYTGMEIADVTEQNSFYKNNQGYTDFLGEKTAQLSALGYPVAHDSGLKMVRTDSVGLQAAPYNVIMGNAQTGGSSGGPWIQNLGKSTSFGGTPATGDASNKVSAVTSWGYTDDAIKIQGASRFANNTTFVPGGDSNIEAILNAICGSNPTKC